MVRKGNGKTNSTETTKRSKCETRFIRRGQTKNRLDNANATEEPMACKHRKSGWTQIWA